MLSVKKFFSNCIFIISCCLLFNLTVAAQPLVDSTKGLFETDDVFEITLSGNMRQVLNDRGKFSEFHPMLVSYLNSDSSRISLPTDIRTRGHFRKLKENCFYPPLLISFTKDEQLRSSVFKDQDKLKLVMPCQGDEYVIHEWLAYKIYNLVTPNSFRVHLVKVKLDDTKNKKTTSPFYGMLLEEHQQMARRTGTVALNQKMKPEQTREDAFLTMAVFEYLIGNTDWSVQYLQNIKLLAADSTAAPATVPYDFDLAGIVNSPYAKPAEELLMNSVRERRYRGYCVRDMKKFDSVISLFNGLKKEIYNIYTNCPLIDAKYVKSTLKYLDEFYATINDPAALQKEFQYPCDKNGTGNVVIKGLRED
jgi:hypothetical protein